MGALMGLEPSKQSQQLRHRCAEGLGLFLDALGCADEHTSQNDLFVNIESISTKDYLQFYPHRLRIAKHLTREASDVAEERLIAH